MKWAVSFCSETGEKMQYFYDYYAKEYRERHMEKLLPAPSAMLQDIGSDKVRSCRTVLRNAFLGYSEGKNREIIKRLVNEYRNYVSEYSAEYTKDRYNAFVYRYMIGVPVGIRAIAEQLGVTQGTVFLYINKVLNELLALCMGIPAMVNILEDREAFVRILIDRNRIFQNMAGEYVYLFFQEQQERKTIELGRKLTVETMQWMTETIEAYSRYCNDIDMRIDTDIRKNEILGKCMLGIPVSCLTKEYGCNKATIYSDIRENEKRLVAMMFET
jgi:hypothetical protein